MPKKRLYLIIAITAIITIGFFLAAYIISQQGNSSAVEQKNPFTNFFPFGKGSTSGTRGGNGSAPDNNIPNEPGNTSSGKNNLLVNPKNIPALRQISTTATAGYSPSLQSGKTSVQFVERSSGNIFETAMEDMRKDRISNALVPEVQEAFWGNAGKSIVYRYIKSGESSVTTVIIGIPNPNKPKVAAQNATTTNQLVASFLPENILSVLVSPDTKNIFYLTKTPAFATRVALGNVFNFQKNTSTRVFQTPFSEWLPVSFDGKNVLLQTKASQNVPGFLYSMNTSTKELQKIIGGINGLTTLPSPDSQKILYSGSSRGGIDLHLYNRKENSTLTIPLATLPEKCVWGIDDTVLYCAAPDYLPSAEYPDNWYQGSVSFNDMVWKIDSKTGNMTTLFSPASFSAPKMDITNLTLSPNKDFLFFINKTDSTLWGYNLTH